MAYQVVLVLGVFAGALLLQGVMRKTAARMQNRIGPPVYQPFIDLAKLLAKENLAPRDACPGYSFWPVLSLATILATVLLVPLPWGKPISFEGDAFLFVYLTLLSSGALFLAGAASGNPLGALGFSRGIAQTFAYEAPFVVGVILPVLSSGTTILAPPEGVLAIYYPFAFLALFLVALAKADLPPFHVPNAHQELVGGYNVEYGGTRLAYIEYSRYVRLLVTLILLSELYLGASVNVWVFLAKMAALVLVSTLLRAILARMRIDQLLKAFSILVLLAFFDLARAVL